VWLCHYFSGDQGIEIKIHNMFVRCDILYLLTVKVNCIVLSY